MNVSPMGEDEFNELVTSAPDVMVDGAKDYTCPCGNVTFFGVPASPFLMSDIGECGQCGTRFERVWGRA